MQLKLKVKDKIVLFNYEDWIKRIKFYESKELELLPEYLKKCKLK